MPVWAFFSSKCLHWNILFSVLDGCGLTHFDSWQFNVFTKAFIWAVWIFLNKRVVHGPGDCLRSQKILWVKSFSEKCAGWGAYGGGLEYKNTRKKVMRRTPSPAWDLKVKLWVVEKEKAWVNAKCSAENGFTRLNRIRKPRSKAGRARGIIHTNRLDGSFRRKVKPL